MVRFLYVLFTLTALGLATLRLMGHHEQWFQAAAHLFVGFLLGLAFTGYRGWRFNLALAVVLSAVEVLAFVRDRIG